VPGRPALVVRVQPAGGARVTGRERPRPGRELRPRPGYAPATPRLRPGYAPATPRLRPGYAQLRAALRESPGPRRGPSMRSEVSTFEGLTWGRSSPCGRGSARAARTVAPAPLGSAPTGGGASGRSNRRGIARVIPHARAATAPRRTRLEVFCPLALDLDQLLHALLQRRHHANLRAPRRVQRLHGATAPRALSLSARQRQGWLLSGSRRAGGIWRCEQPWGLASTLWSSSAPRLAPTRSAVTPCGVQRGWGVQGASRARSLPRQALCYSLQ